MSLRSYGKSELFHSPPPSSTVRPKSGNTYSPEIGIYKQINNDTKKGPKREWQQFICVKDDNFLAWHLRDALHDIKIKINISYLQLTDFTFKTIAYLQIHDFTNIYDAIIGRYVYVLSAIAMCLNVDMEHLRDVLLQKTGIAPQSYLKILNRIVSVPQKRTTPTVTIIVLTKPYWTTGTLKVVTPVLLKL